MALYVPYCSIVEHPIIFFSKIHPEKMDFDSLLRDVFRGNIGIYRLIVKNTPGFAFYYQAGNYGHTVISPDDIRLCLNDEEERRRFYCVLPREEKLKILDERNTDLIRLMNMK